MTYWKREQADYRKFLYKAYYVILILNVIELMAMLIIYLVVQNYVETACIELEQTPLEEEGLQFENLESCKFNLTALILMFVITGSLVYFPLKIHFALVLRSYFKQQRERDEVTMRKYLTATM